MPLTVCECCLDSFDDTAATFRAQLDPILHDIEVVALFLPDPCIALALEDLEDLCLGEIIRHCDRKGDDAIDYVFVAVGNFDDGAGYCFGCIAPDPGAAGTAIEFGGAGEQELEVIVELRHCADSRSRRAHRIGLVDGDRRRNTVDTIDLRLVHALEKLPGVRREGLDVAALSFRVNRVESERRFT